MEAKVLENNRDLILGALNPLLKVENMLGFFRFQVVNGQLKTSSRKMKLYALFVICVVIMTYYVLYCSALSSKSINIFEGASALIKTLQYAVLLVNVSCFNKNSIVIIESFAIIDYELKAASKTVYKKTRQQVLISLSVLIGIYTIGLMYECKNWCSENIYSTFFHLVTDITRHIQLFMFFIFVKLITMRVDILNEYLKQITDLKSENQSDTYSNNQLPHSVVNFNKYFGGPLNKNKREIISLAKAFDALGETTNNINELFNYQIFNALICTFGYSILLSWIAVQYYYYTHNIDTILALMSQCLSELFFIALVCYVCEGMYLKRNTTRVSVNKLIMDYDLPREKRIQAKAFFDLIEVWPMQIHAYDMISIDIKLMLKLISVSTTYLIVVIQMSKFT
ncbi:uncharacterized protein LOC128198621 [Bicyclus anynana]|uniref:Gustatory receptor n=1 Tax=Bicyclus anynana TaxID=110368 RepID=A0ABM3LP83_BICAN|nr:uncharacterized protein LOC128198621 [Bicyclus anynana]